MRTLRWFSCSSSFLQKKEIRKRQGRHKGRHIRTKLHNTDPERVTSETVIIGSNRESIYYLLNLRLLYYFALFYLYDTGSVYYTNIQYTQLLYWACLIVHIYYSASFILVHSNNPALSDLTSFYWSTLIEQNFIISPLFSMVLSFIFWFTLLTHIFIYHLYSWADLLDQFNLWVSLSTHYLSRSN